MRGWVRRSLRPTTSKVPRSDSLSTIKQTSVDTCFWRGFKVQKKKSGSRCYLPLHLGASLRFCPVLDAGLVSYTSCQSQHLSDIVPISQMRKLHLKYSRSLSSGFNYLTHSYWTSVPGFEQRPATQCMLCKHSTILPGDKAQSCSALHGVRKPSQHSPCFGRQHLSCPPILKVQGKDFPGGTVVKNPPASSIYNSQDMEATEVSIDR